MELAADYGLADIVAERYDIGIRLGERLARDMIAVPISPPLRMRVVGAPSYFRQHVAPRHPHELADHNCVTLRLPTHGGLMPWDFGQDGNELSVRVSGQWTFNTMGMTRAAALVEAVDWRGCRRTRCSRCWTMGDCSRCWMTGARTSMATTPTTRRAAT